MTSPVAPLAHLASPRERVARIFHHVGAISTLAGKAMRSIFAGRFQFRAFVYQVEQIGVRSLAIGAATSGAISGRSGSASSITSAGTR